MLRDDVIKDRESTEGKLKNISADRGTESRVGNSRKPNSGENHVIKEATVVSFHAETPGQLFPREDGRMPMVRFPSRFPGYRGRSIRVERFTKESDEIGESLKSNSFRAPRREIRDIYLKAGTSRRWSAIDVNFEVSGHPASSRTSVLHLLPPLFLRP